MIKIIDYKAGNAPSVKHAVTHLGIDAQFARSAVDLLDATHIILPGVGSAKATMDSLEEMQMLPMLEKLVLQEKKPFLGICVGLQMLFEYSEEGDQKCFGWLKGNVRRFDRDSVRVPQMGWNEVNFIDGDSGFFYFVNSYYATPFDPDDIWATTDYGGTFASAVRRGNIHGMQFHVEKSGEAGLALLRRFCSC
ncbi:MAG: imidazole glycerol phosphate synthase subunit HisH [Defluviitaleaceae bacterium]|nr:imidazole glycerol phosphate synthase subunit HisH [Defluviitaleaceae bacterium]